MLAFRLYLCGLLIILLHCSAYNERTNAYKNAAFDILFDHEASQGQIFADCGCHNLVKQVVDVSERWSVCRTKTQLSLCSILCLIADCFALHGRGTTRRFSPTAKRALERPTPWKATSMVPTIRDSLLLWWKLARTRVLCRALFAFSLRWSSRRVARAGKSSLSTAHICRFTKKECTTC